MSLAITALIVSPIAGAARTPRLPPASGPLQLSAEPNRRVPPRSVRVRGDHYQRIGRRRFDGRQLEPRGSRDADHRRLRSVSPAVVRDRIVHHATVLQTTGDSYRLAAAKRSQAPASGKKGAR